MFDILAYSLLAGLFVFYATLVLLFVERESHFGPFASKDKKLVYLHRNPDGDIVDRHEQPINLFDRIRWFFGVYKVVKEDLDESLNAFDKEEYKEVWFVNPMRMELWECPMCLSAWVALIPAAWALTFAPVVMAAFVWGAVSAVSIILHRFTMQDQVEMSFELLGTSDDASN